MDQSKGSSNGGVSQRVNQSLESTTKKYILSGTYLFNEWKPNTAKMNWGTHMMAFPKDIECECDSSGGGQKNCDYCGCHHFTCGKQTFLVHSGCFLGFCS